MLGVLRARPRITVVLAILAIGTGLVLGLARGALADYSFTCAASGCGSNGRWDGYNYIDYDRYSFEGYGDPINGHYDDILGYAWKYYDGHINRWIEYDKVDMADHCANSTTWSNLRNHERAHVRGWGHGEPGNNPAYNRLVGTPC